MNEGDNTKELQLPGSCLKTLRKSLGMADKIWLKSVITARALQRGAQNSIAAAPTFFLTDSLRTSDLIGFQRAGRSLYPGRPV